MGQKGSPLGNARAERFTPRQEKGTQCGSKRREHRTFDHKMLGGVNATGKGGHPNQIMGKGGVVANERGEKKSIGTPSL